MSWENRLTVGDLDDDNGDFEGAGGNGTDIETGTDWVKARLSAEIDNEAGSGVTTYNGSDFCCKIHTGTESNPLIYLSGVNLDTAFAVGNWYKISFDYKTLNCTTAKFNLYNSGAAVDLFLSLPSISWTTRKYVFQLVGNNDVNIRVLLHHGGGENGTEVLWIDNVSIKPHRKRRIISSGII